MESVPAQYVFSFHKFSSWHLTRQIKFLFMPLHLFYFTLLLCSLFTSFKCVFLSFQRFFQTDIGTLTLVLSKCKHLYCQYSFLFCFCFFVFYKIYLMFKTKPNTSHICHRILTGKLQFWLFNTVEWTLVQSMMHAGKYFLIFVDTG